MNPALMAILVCPETHQPLSPAPPEILARLKLEGGLIRADGKRVYPIRNGLPILLIDEAINL